MSKNQPKRGPSPAQVAAGKHLAKHPEASAKELSTKFKIAVTTVYRAAWWKEREAAR